MKAFKLSIFTWILLICFLILPKSCFALEPKFSAIVDQTYKVSESLVTTVTQNYQLKNTTSDFFPTELIIHLPFEKVSNLRAIDRTGALKIEAKPQSDGFEVKISLGEKTVGLAATTVWTLSFETESVAFRKGRFWEIRIPKPSDFEGLVDCTVGLYVPKAFGKIVLVNPRPAISPLIWDRKSFRSNFAEVVFDPSESDTPYQAVKFNLVFDLYNPRFYPVSLEVPLPGDTPYQKIFLESLNPRPESLKIDDDGNWIAVYPLGPVGKTEVVATGSAMVFSTPKLSSQDSFDAVALSQSSKYWDLDNPLVLDLALKLGSPAQTYDYLVNFLPIDQTPGNAFNRLTVGEILKNQRARGCLGFSDSFVALLRARGGASRQVVGFGNGSFHCWAEFFDTQKRQWVSVDPLWGKLSPGFNFFDSFDFSHLSLFSRGRNSSSPFVEMPGESKNGILLNFEITPTDETLDQSTSPHILLRPNFPLKITSGFETKGKIVLENLGPTMFENGEVTIFSNTLLVPFQKIQTGKIVPLGQKTLEVEIPRTNFFTDRSDIISLEFAGETRQIQISTQPVYKNGYFLFAISLVILGIISIIAQFAWSLFWPYKKTKRSNLIS